MSDAPLIVKNDKIELAVRIVGLDEVIRQNATAKGRILDRLKGTLFGFAEQIRDDASAAAPRGETGTLRSGFYARAFVQGDKVTAQMKPRKKAFYAAFHEAGVPRKKVTVREHLRGNQAKRMKRVRLMLGRKWRKRSNEIAHWRGFVHAYRKEVFVPKREMVGPAFARVKDRVQDACAAAVEKALAAEKGASAYD